MRRPLLGCSVARKSELERVVAASNHSLSKVPCPRFRLLCPHFRTYGPGLSGDEPPIADACRSLCTFRQFSRWRAQVGCGFHLKLIAGNRGGRFVDLIFF